ncbi:inositol hexakisphosphate and diphosphoinositol-pentakisphosphate kinase 1-like isoform X1 [Lates japonicus]
MVPSIYPLETLHNSLSLKQVDEFLNTVCESSSEAHAKTMKALSSLFDSQSQTSLYSPQQPLSSSGSETSLRPPSRPLWHGSIPSSAVSSAGPSSPITESSGLNFSFSE